MAGAARGDGGGAPFFRWEDGGSVLVIDVLGKPGAKRDAIGRVMALPGGARLAVHVAAVAEGGKATRRLSDFLAAEFGVAKSDVVLVHGPASVNKQFRVLRPTRLIPGIAPPDPALSASAYSNNK